MTAISVEAVIEEARQRAKHRRLLLAGLAAVVVVSGGIWAGLALSGGGTAATGPVPAGFERVAARGPVTYLVLQERGPEIQTTSLTGRDETPATVTEQFWYDQRGGLTRERVLVDGIVRADITSESCVGPFGCWPAQYMDHFDHSRADSIAAGTGSLRGHHVRWFYQPSTSLRIAVDPQTRKVVDMRTVKQGRIRNELAVLQRTRLPADDVSFVVPKSGAPRLSFSLLTPYSAGAVSPSTVTVTLSYGFTSARRVLGTAPLWPGPRFRGLPLRSLSVGVYSFTNERGELLHSAPYVRFDYGPTLRVDVFGKKRPWYYLHGPPPGKIVREWHNTAALTRDGQLIHISSIRRLPTALPVALAQALRPLPASLKTLPPLRH